MNKRGAVNTALAAIGTIIVIIIIILAIYAVSNSVKEEGFPLWENFLEILGIFQGEIQTQTGDLATAEETELIQTFEAFASGIEECESYSPKKDCGCAFTEDEIPEGAFILVKNLDEGLALATATKELVQPTNPKSFPSKKLGVLYLDYENNEFGCYFPESFYIRSQLQKKYDSVWYIDMGNMFKHFYRFISLNRKEFSKVGELDNFHMIYFIDSLEITEDSAIFRYKKEKGDVNVLVGQDEYFTISFKYNGKKWQYSETNSQNPSSSYHNLFWIGKGSAHYRIKEKLKNMDKDEGLDFLTQFKENIEKLNPDTAGEIVVPNLYKIDENTYCLSTEILWFDPYEIFDLKTAREKGQTKTIDTGYIYLGEALGYLQSTEYCHG
ncbi:MAG: hypothetical protein ABIJ18_05145 [archaeon]